MCIVGLSVLVVTYFLTRPTVDPRIATMEKWLREEQHVLSIGLYREAPNAAPTMIWLANDFVLINKVVSYPLSTLTYDDTIAS